MLERTVQGAIVDPHRHPFGGPELTTARTRSRVHTRAQHSPHELVDPLLSR
jgi:hypothetical protein